MRVTEGRGKNLCLLHEAILTGFHSMVDELLRTGGWTQPEISDALELARARKRYDKSTNQRDIMKTLNTKYLALLLMIGSMHRVVAQGTLTFDGQPLWSGTSYSEAGMTFQLVIPQGTAHDDIVIIPANSSCLSFCRNPFPRTQ